MTLVPDTDLQDQAGLAAVVTSIVINTTGAPAPSVYVVNKKARVSVEL